MPHRKHLWDASFQRLVYRNHVYYDVIIILRITCILLKKRNPVI